MTAARVRRDPRGQADARRRSVAARDAAAELLVVDDPACCVLVVVDAEGGLLSLGDREAMGAARQLADAQGGAVAMLACVPLGLGLRAAPEDEGADRLITVQDAAFAEACCAEARLPAVLAAAEACAAWHLVFPETASGGELGRRVAARLGDRPATGLRRLAGAEAICAADAGRADLVRPLARVLIPAPGAFAPPSGPRREARPIALTPPPPGPVPAGRTLCSDPQSLPLTEAALIIAAGNGLRDWTAFHEAARLLGAAEAGSRVVCDAGWLPRDRQVGSSGALVGPRCYLALGIAGASQHLQGVEAARRVIAVNTDPRSDMLRRADLAIVADVQAVLPALVDRARARLSLDPVAARAD